MSRLAVCVILMGFWASATYAQDAGANSSSMTTSCTFADGEQVSVHFSNGKTDETRNGKPWRPGNAPMTLFTQTALLVNNVEIAPGAYSLWIIPDKKNWTLAVNKDVSPTSMYAQTQDLARTPMEIGQLETPAKQPDLGFAHVSPKECNLRVYFGKVGAFGEIQEK